MAVDEKVKKLLLAAANQINSGDLLAALGADAFATNGTLEMDDEKIDQAEQEIKGLLTKESAKNNPELIGELTEKIKTEAETAAKAKIKSEQLFAVEKGLESFANEAGIDLGVKPGEENAWYKMLEAIKKAEGSGTGDEALKETINTLKAERERLNNQISEINETHSTQIDELKADYARKDLKTTFLLKANTYKWAETFDDKLRGAVLNTTFDELNAKYTLKLDAGEIKVYQKDNPELEAYGEGNKKLTFQTLLEPEIKPYLKKSNGQDTPPPTDKPTPKVERKSLRDVDEDLAAYAEKQRAEFAQNQE